MNCRILKELFIIYPIEYIMSSTDNLQSNFSDSSIGLMYKIEIDKIIRSKTYYKKIFNAFLNIFEFVIKK